MHERTATRLTLQNQAINRRHRKTIGQSTITSTRSSRPSPLLFKGIFSRIRRQILDFSRSSGARSSTFRLLLELGFSRSSGARSSTFRLLLELGFSRSSVARSSTFRLLLELGFSRSSIARSSTFRLLLEPEISTSGPEELNLHHLEPAEQESRGLDQD